MRTSSSRFCEEDCLSQASKSVHLVRIPHCHGRVKPRSDLCWACRTNRRRAGSQGHCHCFARSLHIPLPRLLNVRHFRLFRDFLLSQSVNPPKVEPPLHGGCALRVVPTAKSASRFTSVVFDSDDLARLDGLDGHERNEVFQEDGSTTENNDRNFPMSEVLLVFKSAIHSQENVELRGLGCSQELTVLKSRPA